MQTMDFPTLFLQMLCIHVQLPSIYVQILCFYVQMPHERGEGLSAISPADGRRAPLGDNFERFMAASPPRRFFMFAGRVFLYTDAVYSCIQMQRIYVQIPNTPVFMLHVHVQMPRIY